MSEQKGRDVDVEVLIKAQLVAKIAEILQH